MSLADAAGLVREEFVMGVSVAVVRPATIADEIWHVAHQDRSAWSFNVEVRTFGETW